jgi:hypothetical protein
MRTGIFIVCGLLLWGLCLGAARLLSGANASAMALATWIFTLLWLLVAGANMWMGISKAGYSFSEEFPIFLLIFALPVLAAVFVKWKWLGAP